LRITEGRVLPVERQEVPSERMGKLLFLATIVKPGEKVDKRKLIEYEVPMLGVPVSSWAGVAEKDRLTDVRTPGRYYRRPRLGEDLTADNTAIIYRRLLLRRLEVGDRVQKGDMLGLIRPDLAVADLIMKQKKILAAQAQERTSAAMIGESKQRLARVREAGTGVSKEEVGLAEVTVVRYQEERKEKQAMVQQAQSELVAALATLNMHVLRASIDGEVRTIYRWPGEAAKDNEAVLQLQNPDVLDVEAQVEVKDAQVLWDRIEQAQKWLVLARDLRSKEPKGEADMKGTPLNADEQKWITEILAAEEKDEDKKKLEKEFKEGSHNDRKAMRFEYWARGLLQVEVEAPVQKAPMAVLSGHGQEVTCVAVTHDGGYIISGSEDRTVRLWKKQAGRWAEDSQLDHKAIVRSLAVTGKDSERALLATGTSTGRARIFNLNKLSAGELRLKGRHTGPINAVAFSPDGTRCVTAGEDTSLCLFDTKTGELIGKTSNAHRAAVTSVTFASKDRVVSAGRDQRIVVWKLAEGGLARVSELDRRSGDVGTLGVSPDGKLVLFDDGREMRVMSLEDRSTVGTLRNPAGVPNFGHFALFSPDGKSILTGGNGPGRLQLWRNPSEEGIPPSELRQYLWSGTITCGAFGPPSGLTQFAVTGTSDSRVLVFELPKQKEVETRLKGMLTYAEKFLDTSLRRVTIRASFTKPSWMAPGSSATIVVPNVDK
jgi:WD40 repeat protein